ncbi:MAG: GH3 auxin-responsive promoter family protein [Planctomycetota bacterium]|nr:GH3 auxin-responsive promoter family protein [Planctomycetota bacterium]
MTLAGLLNNAWMLACRREAMAFAAATRRVAASQNEILGNVLRRNRDTHFGRTHSFASIRNPSEYQRRVPLMRYADYADAIQWISEGKQAVLTQDPVEVLEPTSGTTGSASGRKLIPFTRSLRAQFQRAVAAWMFDLLRHRPAIRRGRAYWSISPALGGDRRTPGGVRIGFDADADYLGSTGRWILRRLMATPDAVSKLPDIEAFRYITLRFLLAADDLTLMSIWSPTFLPALLGPLEPWADRLCVDLRTGRLDPPTAIPAELRRGLALLARPRRADELRAIFRASAPLADKLRQAWPRLSLISCWADAAAAHYLPPLRALFPQVEWQPKGLLATEGCVSFPLLDRAGPVLAVRSHFFEFAEVASTEAAAPRLAHQLDAGGRYGVILTTAGGLYRYQLDDLVEVCGFENQCPLLRFLGKMDGVSDQVGEKLAEPFVRSVLSAVFDRHCLAPTFAMLVPVDSRPPRYRLYVQAPAPFDRRAIAAEVDAELRANPHYDYAVRLGQLGAAEVVSLHPGGPSAWGVYERECVARGMRAGNVKPTMLDHRPDWSTIFDPLAL